MPTVYRAALLALFVGLLGWALLGVWYYGEGLRVLAALVLAVPVVALVHSAGTFWAILQPATDFRVTERVPRTKSPTRPPRSWPTRPNASAPIGTTRRTS